MGALGFPQLPRRNFHGRRSCSRTFSSCVLCVSLLLFTPALVLTEDAGVTSIDAGVIGVASIVIGGAGVAGVAGCTDTGVSFVGVTLCADVFSLVASVVVGVVFVLFTRLVRLLGCRSFFLLTGFMRRVNDILHALQAFCLSRQ